MRYLLLYGQDGHGGVRVVVRGITVLICSLVLMVLLATKRKPLNLLLHCQQAPRPRHQSMGVLRQGI